MSNGRGNLGIQNSRKCTDLINKFFECQKNFGLFQKIGGSCLDTRANMDKCLYEEYVERRTCNLKESQERMLKFEQLKRSDDINEI
jgi:hypothetical protein